MHGNDPLRMLRELAELGDLTVTVDASNLPALADARSGVLLLLVGAAVDTDATREVIDQVFDWAEGDCELKIRDENAAVAAAASAVAAPVEADAEGKPAEAARPQLTAVPTAEAPRSAEAGPRRRQLDPRQHREDRRADEHRRRARHHAVDAEPARREASTARSPSSCAAGLAQLERNVRELQESVMRVRMLPISFVFSRFPRMVRDLSQRLGKQVDLKMTGDQTELDKTVLEKIGDPLVHLVRNSVDHGIEMPDVRAAAGKSADRHRVPRGLSQGRQHHRRSRRRRRRPATRTASSRRRARAA